MKWFNVTSHATYKIVPAQILLFEKYVLSRYPFDYSYLHMLYRPVDRWTTWVSEPLKVLDDEFVVFGIDDLLPTNYLNVERFEQAVQVLRETEMDRFSLNSAKYLIFSDAPRTRETTPSGISYDALDPSVMYSVSVQFSVWRLASLLKVLEYPRTPHLFEKKERCRTGFFHSDAPLEWATDSCLSNRRPGKVNIQHLNDEDVQECVRRGLLDPSEFIYGWKGDS